MSHEYAKLYEKVLTDPVFRVLLNDNPALALESIGIPPTEKLLAAIREVLEGLRKVQIDLGQDPDDPKSIT